MSARDIAWQPSPNHEPRQGPVDMLVFHYTGMDTAEGARRWLCSTESKVSAHYLVDEAGAVTQMVGEDRRAWHAGVSCWAGQTDINSCSIGIEVHNMGPFSERPEFPDAQIAALVGLAGDILARHRIAPRRVLAHSDVAPGRKVDPGPYFPWQALAAEGIGLWREPPVPEGDGGYGPGDSGEDILNLQQGLAAFGYCVAATGVYDSETEAAVRSFQLHFRPVQADGWADRSTRAALANLLTLCGAAGA